MHDFAAATHWQNCVHGFTVAAVPSPAHGGNHEEMDN